MLQRPMTKRKRHKPGPSPKLLKLQNGSLTSYILGLIPYDIHCGTHSGFPECCIKFWVTKWIWESYNETKYAVQYRKQLMKFNPGYIACPRCLRSKKFIAPKSCPKSCRLKILVKIGGNENFDQRYLQ